MSGPDARLRARLDGFVRAAGRQAILLGLDFDGTLARIVENPQAARPESEAVALVSELSHKVRMLAIVSGRDTDFFARLFPADRLLLIGNHGLEERTGGESRLIPEAAPYSEAVRQVAESADALVRTGAPDASVERKRATVAVHLRRARDPGAAMRWLRPRLEDLAMSNGLALREGRLVFELRPPIDVDKGQVVDRLVRASGAAAVLFAGDDRTDADAFAALRRWRAQGMVTLAVAVRSSESPPELFADADLVVDGVDGVIEMLRALNEDRL